MRKVLTALAAAVLVPLAGTQVAQASPAGSASYILPQRWNDDYKPGSSCATPGETGIYVQAERRWFKQTDAASVANRNDKPVPVKQTVKQTRKEVTTVSATFEGTGDITKYLSSAYGFNYVRVVSWSFGQTVGPYQLDSGKQGKLVWGFMMLDVDAQNVRCTEDMQWAQQGKPYSATTPESRYAELRLDEAPNFG